MDNRKILLSVGEAANILSVSRTTLYALIDAGKIQRVKIGNAARIPAASVHEFVEALAQAA